MIITANRWLCHPPKQWFPLPLSPLARCISSGHLATGMAAATGAGTGVDMGDGRAETGAVAAGDVAAGPVSAGAGVAAVVAVRVVAVGRDGAAINSGTR